MKASTQLFRYYTIADAEPEKKFKRKKKARGEGSEPDKADTAIKAAIDKIAPEWSGPVLVIDFETLTDANSGQAPRFGAFQYRRMKYEARCEAALAGTLTRNMLDQLVDTGIIYNKVACEPGEIALMETYCKNHMISFLTLEEFVYNVFYKPRWIKFADDPEDRLKEPMLVIGHNLAFDLSRMSKRHGLARGKNYGGLVLHLDPRKPGDDENDEDAADGANENLAPATDVDKKIPAGAIINADDQTIEIATFDPAEVYGEMAAQEEADTPKRKRRMIPPS